MSKNCSFCKAPESVDNRLLAGDGIYICENCVISAYKIFFGDDMEELDLPDFDMKHFTPKELKKVLDDFVIGQDDAKKVFAVGVYNHYKRIFKQHTVADDTEIQKSNILLIGPTGSGKTLMAQTLAKHLDVPIAITDATSLTEAGYVGEDVENILTRLLQVAEGDVAKAERGIVFVDEIDKIARMGENRSITRDVSGEGVQQALLKIIEGSLVNISPKGGRKHPNQEFSQIDTSNILFICGGAFDGLGDIIKKRLGNNVLGFNQEKRGKEEEKELLSLVEPDDLVAYGLIPELIGRLHSVTTLNQITKEDMVRILTEPKNAIVKQYQKLFAIDDVALSFENEALLAIAELALKRKTGARGLRTIMEEVMVDIMYELPELAGYEVLITEDVIKKVAKPIYVKPTKKERIMLVSKILGLFSRDLSIDLGTANTIVIVKGKGIVINEPSVVAVQINSAGKKKVLAVRGREAKEMLGKTPENIEAIRPLKEGVIADFDVTEKMIKHLIQKSHARNSFIRPRIIICVPYGLTQVERKAVKESAMNAGARDVILVEEPKAAAIGAGLPIQGPKGNMVIDIGGGTTEIGVISLGGLVKSKSIRVGGDKFDQAIVEYIKKKFNLLIGDRTGEEIKIEIATAIAPEELKMVIKGRDQVTGLLKSLEITSKDIRDAISEPLKEIGDAVKQVLEVMPPDLAGDIVENGIVLTGGGSLIRGLDSYLSKLIKLPVYISEEPLLAVAKGTERMLEEIELLQQIQSNA